ncbi:MAG: asparaginase domain-containing protein [Treponema sp.]
MYLSFVFLEIRVLIPSKQKAFCPCNAGIESAHCPICMRAGGTAPLLTAKAAEDAYRLSQSLNCSLIPHAAYEYPCHAPEMPPEYPLCGASVKLAENGWIDIDFHQRKKRIHILEIRIEEDAGKLIHADQKTFMDYSTAGMPSIRIRTANSIELGEEAEIFLTELKNRMCYIGLLADGQINQRVRCNAYTASTEFPNTPEHYVKLRNLNSFNFVRQAINEDLKRQEALLRNGEKPISESRLWNARQERTVPYQSRVFSDSIQTYTPPTVQYFSFSEQQLEALISTVPENQPKRRNRYIQELGLSVPIAQSLCEDAAVADFFDAALRCGGAAQYTAHRLLSDVAAVLKRTGKTITESRLTPDYFAQILRLSENGTVNHAIIRSLLQQILLQDADPAVLLKQREWATISDKKTLQALIQSVISKHPDEAEKLQSGTMKYLDILAGLVMKETKGFADQNLVKQLIKEELHISIIYVLSMGGTISGQLNCGKIAAGGMGILSRLLDDDMHEQPHYPPQCGRVPQSVQFENITPNGLLSEELEPADWARLIHAVCVKIASGTANGIVLAHGTDTLVYTAPLIYWLFAHTNVPIVLTASNTAPLVSDEAKHNLNDAIRLAWEKQKGVYVSFNGKVLSPLNLKFIGSSAQSFVNWNMKTPIFEGEGLLTDYEESDTLVFESLLSEAAHNMFLIKTYPGIRTEFLLAFLQKNIRIFFLELYERGTANMKESPYSLKEFLDRGKKYHCKFYCTSQQEAAVDFSEYESALNLWKQGAVPMGMLTTETAIALYYAASLVCDTADELNTIMENAAAGYAGQQF